ncbi:hypothetical protein LPJ66_001981 [Kickxella alabastrina]|uniref:Uncharacterized protein n=1 Tax=Kickxella alabastrina TaxID=61397 RepID=A0ACC1IRS2_9FUNG|nr:hypothetical protein LPJ66_001981 [Kickxella alabastrina]
MEEILTPTDLNSQLESAAELLGQENGLIEARQTQLKVPTTNSRALAHYEESSGNDDSSADMYEEIGCYTGIHARATPPEDTRKAAIDSAYIGPAAKMLSDRVMNFRDLGVSIIELGLKLHNGRSRAESEGPLPGVVFRSAELGSACEEDVRTLFLRFGIRTIIDLRSEVEAHASDIVIYHYPASIQPTVGQSLERLMKLLTFQVHSGNSESADTSHKTTDESQDISPQGNALQCAQSFGLVNKAISASGTVPAFLRSSLAQAAIYWGSQVLQLLRSYWGQKPLSSGSDGSIADEQEPLLNRADTSVLHSSGSASLDSLTSDMVVTNKFYGIRRRYRCNVIGNNYRNMCVWANTPWVTRIKVIMHFAMFNKAEAIRTIGREVLTPRGLAGSYEDFVDYCKVELAAVLRIFADPTAYPILFHCQHGKDRTGIIAMLLLGILDVNDEIIAADYELTQNNLLSVRDRMVTFDMGAVGLPESFCDSPAPAILNLLRHIRTNYGSVRKYLLSAGLLEQEINSIVWCLRGNFLTA